MTEPFGDLDLGSGLTPFAHHSAGSALFTLTDDAATFPAVPDVGPEHADRSGLEMEVVRVVKLAIILNERCPCPHDQFGSRSKGYPGINSSDAFGWHRARDEHVLHTCHPPTKAVDWLAMVNLGGTMMTDDKSNRGARDRATVAGGEKYEVDHLMKALNLNRDDAEQLIKKYNGNRERITAEVNARKVRR